MTIEVYVEGDEYPLTSYDFPSGPGWLPAVGETVQASWPDDAGERITRRFVVQRREFKYRHGSITPRTPDHGWVLLYVADAP